MLCDDVSTPVMPLMAGYRIYLIKFCTLAWMRFGRAISIVIKKSTPGSSLTASRMPDIMISLDQIYNILI